MADSRLRSERGNAPVRPENGLWHRPRLLNFLSDLLVLAAVAAFGYAAVVWVLTRAAFPLEQVVLQEAPRYLSLEDIEGVARTALRGNFFTLELAEVKARFEALPWVRSAEVRRRWPATVEVSLQEHDPAAHWLAVETGARQMVDKDGTVFPAKSELPLPQLSGPQGSAPQLLEQFAEFSRMVAPLGQQLTGLSLSPRLAWQLQLDNGMIIRLGRDHAASAARERLERFVSRWPEASQKLGMKVAAADLRYPGGFALTPETTAKGRQ